MSDLLKKRNLNINPKIYVYTLPNATDRIGLLKIGQTNRKVNKRIKEQIGTSGIAHKVLLNTSAMRNDGTSFTDHEIHRYLRKKGFDNPDGEWFRCSLKDVKSAIIAIKKREVNEENRSLDFKMRPEQKFAVKKTMQYFRNYKEENPDKTPKFLWNAKMRFGKTFTSYKLAQKMNWTKVLVLTFKPAVQSAWREDLMTHIDFEGWQFISRNEDDFSYEDIDKKKPFVTFASFQDFLGKNKSGGIKLKNEWAHGINWDCVILDEYHYGAWRDNAKDLFESEDKKEIKELTENYPKYFTTNKKKSFDDNYFEDDILPIATNAFLYLSGTPFRAITSGEFIEEQIFNWTYSDEQREKENWKGDDNPYLSLPKMIMLTYQMPENIKDVAIGGEFNEFDLNIFFKAEGEGEDAKFILEEYVQKWLDLIRGGLKESILSNLKLKKDKPPMPFSDSRLLTHLAHTFWFLPSVASCYAMRNLIKSRQNTFYNDYNVVVAAGTKAGIGVKALPPVYKAMKNPLKTKTITLSCGKLTTGVSIKPWSGILMLRNSSSPETYFQAAFRVQTPWIIKNSDSKSPNKIDIIKETCYIFDFAPNRALGQVADYACRLNVNESNPEKNVAEFIHFLPVLAYDGSSMKQIDAAGVLDIAMSGTTSTLLAKRWESALLVNVDNATLQRLLDNPKVLEVLKNIEGFRNLNKDIETIINKSGKIKKAKREGNDDKSKTKKELSKEEKEYKSLRKQIQDKLIKFATRIPIFMYLTDYREVSLQDVIMKLEPDLFEKVTALTVKDFELLVSLGVFNGPLMNDAIYKFKRYEDASLEYVGFAKHDKENIGGYDEVISKKEYKNQ